MERTRESPTEEGRYWFTGRIGGISGWPVVDVNMKPVTLMFMPQRWGSDKLEVVAGCSMGIEVLPEYLHMWDGWWFKSNNPPALENKG